MKLIVHFGMPKTGTSSIQLSLFAALDSPRFHYLNAGTPNLNRTLVDGFRKDASRYFTNRLPSAPVDEAAAGLEARSSLVRSIRDGGDKTGILSSEYLTAQGEPEFRQLTAFLRKFYSSLQFVGYIRKPKAFMESAFQQTLKVQFRPFNEKNAPVRYRKWLAKFYEDEGDSAVLLRPFERSAFPSGCVVQDFCSELRIPFDPAQVVNVNESLSLPAVQLLYAHRKFGKPVLHGKGEAWRANLSLSERLKSLPGARFSIHSAVFNAVMKNFMDEVGWAEARLGSSLAEDLESDDATAVRDEAQLLRISPEAIGWLNAQLAPPEQADPKTPEDVAMLVGTLYTSLLREEAEPRTRQMPRLADRSAADAAGPTGAHMPARTDSLYRDRPRR